MSMQISPFGVLIIAAYSAIVLLLLVWPVARVLKEWRLKWWLLTPLATVLLALPWAEEAWIAWNFERLCKDAGVHVVRKVEVDGYYDATGGGIAKPGPTDPPTGGRERFRFYERLVGYDPKVDPLRVSHVENTDGVWTVTILDRPTARYHYRYAYQPTPYRIEEPVGWKLEKTERQVFDSQTSEIIGTNVLYKRRPSVVEGLWIGLLGSGLTICPNPEKGPFPPPFPESVLLPATKSKS